MGKATDILGVFGLVVAAPLLYVVWTSGDAEADKPEISQYEQDAGTARLMCQQAIKQTLHDPDSAEWGRVYNWPTGLMNGNDAVLLVQPEIRATNGFGGKVLTRFECRFDVLPDGQGVRFAGVSEI